MTIYMPHVKLLPLMMKPELLYIDDNDADDAEDDEATA